MQRIGPFKGFQANINEPVPQSEAHYFLTLPKSPYKSVINDVMMRLVDVAEKRNMPFIQLVGDLPVYALIVQLKNENVDCFQTILPVIGAFHAQCSFIAAINKRFGGSGLSDILSAAGVIAEKSVDQALRGKHYSRACRALQLVYETLQRRILGYGLSEGVFLSEDFKKMVKLIADGNLPNESKEALVLELQQNDQLCTFIDQTWQISGLAS